MRIKKNEITKNEKMLYFIGVSCLFLTIIMKVFFGASIGNYKMSNEQLNQKITTEGKTVESLTMQVNELTSFDNVEKVVKDLGLAYNNDNIIVVGD